MAAGVDIFIIDFLFRPFAKIYQKMPFLTFVILCIIYGIIAYVVWRSAFKESEGQS